MTVSATFAESDDLSIGRSRGSPQHQNDEAPARFYYRNLRLMVATAVPLVRRSSLPVDACAELVPEGTVLRPATEATSHVTSVTTVTDGPVLELWVEHYRESLELVTQQPTE